MLLREFGKVKLWDGMAHSAHDGEFLLMHFHTALLTEKKKVVDNFPTAFHLLSQQLMAMAH